MITNLLFTALCLGLVLIAASDAQAPRSEPRRVRVRTGETKRN